MPLSSTRRACAVRLRPLRRLAVSAALAAICCGVQAQGAAPPAGAASGGELTPAERAKRDADKVFQWIRIHSDKPRKAAAAPQAEKPAPAATPAVRSAAKPAKGDGITETVQPAPVVAAPTVTPATTAAALGRPEPARPAPQPVAATPAAAPPSPAAVTAAALPKAEAAPIAPAAPIVEEDVVLTPVLRTEPEFPGSLMRQLRKGLVQVSFTVQPDGTVAQPHVVSTTHPRLSPVALATVSQWRFQPLRHAQTAVVDLGFNLD